MLLLGRKPGQWVLIKNEIGKVICRVTVVRGKFGQLKLGFEAPPEIIIIREELDGIESNRES